MACDWWWGGKIEFRGWRPIDHPFGAISSLHKFWRATDFFIDGIPSQQVRADIRNNPNAQMFKYIRRVEEGTEHVHIDFGNHDRETYGIKWFNP